MQLKGGGVVESRDYDEAFCLSYEGTKVELEP